MRASAEQQASGETSWPGPGPTQTGWRYHKPVCSMYFRLFSLFLVQLEMKKKWVRRGRGMTTRGARAGTYLMWKMYGCTAPAKRSRMKENRKLKA